MEALLGAQLEGLLWVAAALGARIGPVIYLAPFLGGRLVPASVKPALVATFGALVYPLVGESAAALAAGSAGLVACVLAKEAFVGLALGFIVAIVFHAVAAAGWLVDALRGANLAEVLAPQGGQRTSPLGSLGLQLTVVLFISVGGHRLFVAALAESYRAVPLAVFPRAAGVGGLAALAIRLSGDLFLVATALAAPVIVALLLADAILGWINRFAPQVNVYFAAMPLKALLGVLVLALGSTLLVGGLPPLLDAALQGVHGALDALGR